MNGTQESQMLEDARNVNPIIGTEKRKSRPWFLGKNNPMWRGGTKKTRDGRNLVLNRNHTRSDCNGYVLKSIVMAEKVLGKPLPHKSQVHHFSGDPSKDTGNLIICENQAYHHLLHQRKRAYDACGNANWRKCRYCGEYDAPVNLYIPINHTNLSCHKECKNRYERERYCKQHQQAKEL